MTNLPRLPYSIQKTSGEINVMRGINLSDNTQDGDLAGCKNLSIRRFPYFTTRRSRRQLTEYAGATALTSWEKLVVVQGGQIYYDGAARGAISNGEKQFAVVNSKLVIWPDKKYLDMNTLTVKDLGAAASGSGATFGTNTITVSWSGTDLSTLFSAGDCITISGCTAQEGNNKDIVIQEVAAKVLTFTDGAFTAATESGTITLERKIPDMDFVFENDNRLWGCSNETKTIYASALGDPTNLYVYEGLSTDSYALTVGSEGDFTGCCKLSASILFWKDHTLHKILGDIPADYTLYTYNLEGVLAGCNKSLQVINETLYYMSAHGVYAYSGGTTALLTMEFGQHHFTDAVAGTDGMNYYLSAREGEEQHLFVYNTTHGTWVREDETKATDFTRMGRDLYFLDDGGNVFLADSGVESNTIEWYAQFAPFYETVQGRKGFSKLLLRVELPKTSWLLVEMRCDGGRWLRVGEIRGGERDVEALPIGVDRCDKFELRLSGKGQCTVLSMLRQFTVGSER